MCLWVWFWIINWDILKLLLLYWDFFIFNFLKNLFWICFVKEGIKIFFIVCYIWELGEIFKLVKYLEKLFFGCFFIGISIVLGK